MSMRTATADQTNTHIELHTRKLRCSTKPILKAKMIGEFRDSFDKDQVWEELHLAYEKLLANVTWHRPNGSVYNTVTSLPAEAHRVTASKLVRNMCIRSLVNHPTKAYLLCIDEGVQDLAASRQAISISVPGCGILASDGADSLLCQIATILKEQNIEEIIVTSHEGCGAASLAAAKQFGSLNPQRLSYFQNLVDLIADDFSKQVAIALQKKLTRCEVEFAHIHKLSRPAFHDAFGTILSFSPLLNSGTLERKLGLPLFNISGYLMDEPQLLYNVKLAYGIATGSHGMGAHFDQNNPFLTLIVVNDKNEETKVNQTMAKLTDNIVYTVVNLGV